MGIANPPGGRTFLDGGFAIRSNLYAYPCILNVFILFFSLYVIL